MKPFMTACLLGMAIVTAVPAFAQGDYPYENPEPITGIGDFPYDLSGFRVSFYSLLHGCVLTTRFDFYDGFFEWTVPASGSYTISLRSASGSTPTLRLYAGEITTAACLGPNFYTSTHNYPNLVSGQTIQIRIGKLSAGGPAPILGTGTLTIDYLDAPCSGQPDDIYEDNDTCQTAVFLPATSVTGLATSFSDPDYWKVMIPAGQRLGVEVAGDVPFGIKRYRENCDPLGPFGSEVYRTNHSAVAQQYTFGVESVDCLNYSIDYQLVQDLCAVSGQDDGFEPNDTCETATPVSNGTYANLFASEYSNDLYSFCLGPGETATFAASFLESQSSMALFLRVDGPYQGCRPGNENFYLSRGFDIQNRHMVSYTNHTSQPFNMSVEVMAVGEPSIQSRCASYDLTVSGLSGCNEGQRICTPNFNSSGDLCLLTGTHGSRTGSGLHLSANGGPRSQFGYFIMGTQINSNPLITLGNGKLCVGGNIGRYNLAPGSPGRSLGVFDLNQEFQNMSGTARSHAGVGFDVPSIIPITGNPVIQRGTSVTFQLWFRDPGAGTGQSNASDGYMVTF